MTSMTFDETIRIIQAITVAGVSVTVVFVIVAMLAGFLLFYKERSARIASASEAKTALTLFKLMLAYFVSGGQIPPNDAADMEQNAADPLYQALLDHFNHDELETLAANVGLDIEYVPGGPLPNVVLRLKRMTERTGKRAALIAAMQLARPGLLKELR